MDAQQHSNIMCIYPKKATSNEQTPNKKSTALNLQVRIILGRLHARKRGLD